MSDNINDIDWLGKPYYSLNAYFKHTYGQKVYKIAVDAGLTCPNRDGKLDTRGCIFCSAGGSGDFAVGIESTDESRKNTALPEICHNNKVDWVRKQIEEGLKKFNKSVGDKFVIYFQAFTNTYGDIDYLRKIWSEALEYDDVVGISIATRPDCLGHDIIELLGELKNKYCTCSIDCTSEEKQDEVLSFEKNKFIWVELGLQTIHDKTAGYIRRHYPLSFYEEAVIKLGKLDIPYITHIIFGLPGETKEDMLETVFYVEQGIFDYDRHGQIKPFGIKLQLLHVLENTDLALDYEAGKFQTMEMDEYIELVIDALQKINPNIVIHRVTGDGPKSILISPTWSGNKKLVLNTLHKRMSERNARQGDYSIMLW
ncbi:MAG: radical SAM protein [Lachnospiraceae bacterium]|nr:radical SAM protein [Lachnospiraceae bacterium]